VEFDAPIGYKEPERKPKFEEDEMDVDQAHSAHIDDKTFYAFKGEGSRLDGKKIKDSLKNDPPSHILKKYIRGIPDYEHNIFELKFDRSLKTKSVTKSDKDEDQFKTFQGEGQSLRTRKQ
jgi:ubiquitin fusion degradation protein 1